MQTFDHIRKKKRGQKKEGSFCTAKAKVRERGEDKKKNLREPTNQK